MPDRERKRVPEHRSDVPKGRISAPGSSCQSWEHGRCEYPRLSEESEKESGDEAAQRGLQEPCTTDVQKRGKNTEGGKKRRRDETRNKLTHTHTHTHTHARTHARSHTRARTLARTLARTHARTHARTTFPEADLQTEGAA